MPFTFNGIGTMHYGKKNLEEYKEICENCGEPGWLISYETRLWFTIFFIPIIPLGSQQVIDYCSSCTNHREIPLAEWNRQKARAAEKSRTETEPANQEPAAAMENHKKLVYYGNKQEAESLARKMAQTFPEDIDVQLYLGNYYLREEREDEALIPFEQVLRLDPGNLEARQVVGMACLRKRDLFRARQLLSFMLEPGPQQDAEVILEMASALCEVERYAEAYHYLETIARDFPYMAAKNSEFHRMVKEIEALIKPPHSILPRSDVGKRLALTGMVVIAFLGILFLLQMAIRQRTIHVVNGLPAKATLSIPGERPVVVAPSNRSSIVLTEGEYEASIKIENGPTSMVKFTVSGGWWEWLTAPSFYVLNIGGAAVIFREKIQYSEKPSTDAPYYLHFYVGEPFIKLRRRDVDYLFEKGARVWKGLAPVPFSSSLRQGLAPVPFSSSLCFYLKNFFIRCMIQEACTVRERLELSKII